MVEAAARRDLGDARIARRFAKLSPCPIEPQIARVLERRATDEATEMLMQSAARHAAGRRELADSPSVSRVGVEPVKRRPQVARDVWKVSSTPAILD